MLLIIQDMASLLSFIASVFALPAAPSLGVAKSILGVFGLSASATSFLIPDYYLQSTYEEINYNLTDTDSSSHQNTFFGAKYIITEDGGHLNDVYIEGTYYPTSSWGDHNFGTTIYSYLFSYSNWKIYAWN